MPIMRSAPIAEEPGRRPRSGTILFICLALVTTMTAIAFAFVAFVRTAGSLGPTDTPRALAQQAARAGTAHLAEVLIRDYLKHADAYTSDLGPHRIFFDPIDNVNATNPREVRAQETPSAAAWNDNDVFPSSYLVNQYRSTGWFYTSGLSWLDMLVSPTLPRYIEPGYWTLDRAAESGESGTKLDFTIAPSTSPPINSPLYFDATWRPVANRSLARYRLRYAVQAEDLTGHILSGLQGPFGREDPLLPDGDANLIPASQRGKGLGQEFDHAWARKYAPAFSGFLYWHGAAAWESASRSTGDLYYSLASIWMGTAGHSRGDSSASSRQAESDQTGLDRNNTSRHSSGFDDQMILRGPDAWTWYPTTSYAPGLGPVAGNLSRSFPGKIFSWTTLRSVDNDRYGGWNLAATVTPYASPSFWRRRAAPAADYHKAPDPESSEPSYGYAYNEGPTDNPWRINPLTAPTNALKAMLCAYRSPPLWEQGAVASTEIVQTGEDSWAFRYIGTGTDGKPRRDDSYDTVIDPPLLVYRNQFPNPFRASFETKARGADLRVHPFAQFPVARWVLNPRSTTRPFYPSPAATYYRDNLGRYSDLYHRGERFFNREASAGVGVCTPRYDYGVRPLITQPPQTLDNIANWGPLQEVSGATSTAPWGGTGIRYLINKSYTRDANNQWTYTREGDAGYEYGADSYWNDALAALGSSVALAIAHHQPNLPGNVPVVSGARDLPASASYRSMSSRFHNVADLDREFLTILGEDPNRPGDRDAPTLAFDLAVQQKVGDVYQPAVVNVSNSGAGLGPAPAAGHAAAVSRTSLSALRGNATPYAFDDGSDNKHRTEALNLLGATASALPASDQEQVAKQKFLQLKRMRLRDAERVINDMRMSFFGANLRYQAKSGSMYASDDGRFRPLDLDGDGWAICSAYIPSEVDTDEDHNYATTRDAQEVALPSIKPTKHAYRFATPKDWTRVAYVTNPDAAGTADWSSYDKPMWVCYRDIDATDPAAPLASPDAIAPALLDGEDMAFTDRITYTGSGTFPGGGPERRGYTRWFYPASRVVANSDRRASNPPDTYFSITGFFVFEKSRFYRVISRGEVWDEWRRQIVDFTALESVFMIDPDGDVYAKPGNINGSGQILDAAGMIDTAFVYQGWLNDRFKGDKDQAGETR